MLWEKTIRIIIIIKLFIFVRQVALFSKCEIHQSNIGIGKKNYKKNLSYKCKSGFKWGLMLKKAKSCDQGNICSLLCEFGVFTEQNYQSVD